MGRKFVVVIGESIEELRKQLKAQKTGRGKEKMQMLYWLKKGEILSRNELAERLNHDNSTIYRWLKRYKEGGIERLLEEPVRPGRNRSIPEEVIAALTAELEKPKGFNSYGDIQSWLQENYGLAVPYSTVHRIVRYELKAKKKVPRPRSTEASEAQQQTYKKNCLSSLR